MEKRTPEEARSCDPMCLRAYRAAFPPLGHPQRGAAAFLFGPGALIAKGGGVSGAIKKSSQRMQQVQVTKQLDRLFEQALPFQIFPQAFVCGVESEEKLA